MEENRKAELEIKILKLEIDILEAKRDKKSHEDPLKTLKELGGDARVNDLNDLSDFDNDIKKKKDKITEKQGEITEKQGEITKIEEKIATLKKEIGEPINRESVLSKFIKELIIGWFG